MHACRVGSLVSGSHGGDGGELGSLGNWRVGNRERGPMSMELSVELRLALSRYKYCNTSGSGPGHELSKVRPVEYSGAQHRTVLWCAVGWPRWNEYSRNTVIITVM